MPMTLPVGEAESNPIMIAVMDAKSITAIVVLVRMGMAATPPPTIFTPAARLSSTLSTAAQPKVADFILMGELIAHDALSREESCGGHFREEHQTPEGEAQRDDENFFYVGCWEYKNNDETAPELIKEPLEYEAIKVQTRNYKN